jgi:hypothetical protein
MNIRFEHRFTDIFNFSKNTNFNFLKNYNIESLGSGVRTLENSHSENKFDQKN